MIYIRGSVPSVHFSLSPNLPGRTNSKTSPLFSRTQYARLHDLNKIQTIQFFKVIFSLKFCQDFEYFPCQNLQKTFKRRHILSCRKMQIFCELSFLPPLLIEISFYGDGLIMMYKTAKLNVLSFRDRWIHWIFRLIDFKDVSCCVTVIHEAPQVSSCQDSALQKEYRLLYM